MKLASVKEGLEQSQKSVTAKLLRFKEIHPKGVRIRRQEESRFTRLTRPPQKESGGSRARQGQIPLEHQLQIIMII
jgi:hypothetical protein